VVDYDVKMQDRTLAIVLLDLIGSTQFVQKVGAQRAAQHFQYHDRLARSLVYKFNGREIDRSDGFLLSFDRVIDAVNFSLHYQTAVPPRTHLDARIGIHWGTVVEVIQDDVFVAANAKRVELEGISKNIAARTMSLCQARQVLLTKQAMYLLKGRTNTYTPKGTRYACMGLYKFKGVNSPMEVYAVGDTIESLQPPPGSEKVKRIGGPNKIKSRARDRKIMEWVWWLLWKLFYINLIYYCILWFKFVSYPHNRELWGIHYLDWVDYVAWIYRLVVYGQG